MDFTIRFANKNDMKAVHDLIVELAIYEREEEQVEITIADLQRDGFAKHPRFKVLIAEADTKIIGMALFYERYSTWKGKAIHLEDLIVTESKRNTGVGKALYTELMEYAEAHNYGRVAWEVLDWNKNAIDFYENSGARVLDAWRVVHMSKENLKKYIRE